MGEESDWNGPVQKWPLVMRLLPNQVGMTVGRGYVLSLELIEGHGKLPDIVVLSG